MEPRITQTTQGVSELSLNIDAIELTDKDLEKVTGTHWGWHHSAIAFNQAAIANGRGGVAFNQAAIANGRGGVAFNQAAIA